MNPRPLVERSRLRVVHCVNQGRSMGPNTFYVRPSHPSQKSRGARPAGTGSGRMRRQSARRREAGSGSLDASRRSQAKRSEPRHTIDRRIQATEGVPRRALISPFVPTREDTIGKGQELAPASRRDRQDQGKRISRESPIETPNTPRVKRPRRIGCCGVAGPVPQPLWIRSRNRTSKHKTEVNRFTRKSDRTRNGCSTTTRANPAEPDSDRVRFKH